MHLKRLVSFAVAGAAITMAPAAQALPSTSDTRMLTEPALSATHLAFIYAGDVWLANPDGGAPRRLTSDPGEKSNPQFSPDGKLIAYSCLLYTSPSPRD